MKKTIYVFTCALCALFVLPGMAQVPAYVPADGLVGWWPFNGNANDESGNGNDGEVNGATLTLDRYNQPNRSFNFSSSDHYIRVLENESLSLDSNFCISLWFRAESTTSFNSFLSKSSCLNGDIPGYTCGLWDFFSGGQNPRVNFQAYPYLNDATPTLPQEITVIELNNWHHFVVTYEHLTNTMNYYLDNVFLESLEVNFEIDDTNLDLIIGNHLDVFNGLCESTFMIGQLDDIAIYNRALTPEEITALYTGEPVSPPAACNPLPTNLQNGLLGYWPFCGNANDESGNGNNGTVNGATLTEDRFGNADAAYDFDGVDDFIEIINSGSLISSSGSVSSWIRVSDSMANDQQLIFGQYQGTPQLVINTGNNLKASIGWPSQEGIPVNAISTSSIINMQWINIVGTYSNNELRIYFNGQLESSISTTLNQVGCNSDLFNIGGFNATNVICGGAIGVSQVLDGSLDDIGIWNRALTAEEVQQLYTHNACAFTVYDTITVENVISVYDTLTIENEVIVYDTIITDIENVINVYDTNYVNIEEVVYDTIYTTTENIINIYDTTYTTIENTIDVYDTTIVNEYITVTDTLLIEITFTGVEGQPNALNTVTVFPNPASDHITIDYGNFALMAGYNTVITDAAGATVYSSAINSQQAYIDINAWGAAGVYYMTIYDAGGAAVALRHIVLE